MARELTDEQRLRLAKAIRDDVWPRVRGNHREIDRGRVDQSAIGRELSRVRRGETVQASTISRLLSDHPSGGSHRLATIVSEFLNQPKEIILDGATPERAVPRLREIPGYDEARAEAERRIVEEKRAITPRAIERASDACVVPVPSTVNATTLLGLAVSFQDEPSSASRMRVARKK